MKFPILLVLFTTLVNGLWMDTNNVTNIINNANIVAKGLLNYYTGLEYGGTIGMFSLPYYWWEAGGAWGSLIDYAYLTNNDTLVPMIKQALEYQVGDDFNYIPLNQSTTEGNDDQGFWGIAVMSAAERNISNPSDPRKAWLTLAQAVFNTMTARWDEKECNGGLRWQIFQWNSGYDYKNSVSNGCLFHIGARLARYTGNDSYVDWADKVWDWMYGVGVIDEEETYTIIYDGVKINNNCSTITKLQWTYNQGLMLSGCAYLYNFTEDEKWLKRTKALLAGSVVFFHNDTMYEAQCQSFTSANCNNDQRSFKAYFARFLGMTSTMVPETAPQIYKWMVASANAAAGTCSGGSDWVTCGLNWFNSTWDGYYGLGEQMAALEVFSNLLVNERPPPYTAANGGSSLGNPAAGYAAGQLNASPLALDTADMAGAGIITAVIGASLVGAAVWLIL